MYNFATKIENMNCMPATGSPSVQISVNTEYLDLASDA